MLLKKPFSQKPNIRRPDSASVFLLILCFTFWIIVPQQAESSAAAPEIEWQHAETTPLILAKPAVEVQDSSPAISPIAENAASPNHETSLSWLIRTDNQSPLSQATPDDTDPPIPEKEEQPSVMVRFHGYVPTNQGRILVLSLSNLKTHEIMILTMSESKRCSLSSLFSAATQARKDAALKSRNAPDGAAENSARLPLQESSVNAVVSSVRDGASWDETKEQIKTMTRREDAKVTTYLFEFKQMEEKDSKLSDILRQGNAPKIAQYMWKNFSYESDQRHLGHEDYWQSPAELFASKKGDCEDFALFATGLLTLNKIPSFMLNIYSNRSSHTVAVGKENGKFYVIDGTSVKSCKADNLTDLLNELNPFWKKSAIVSFAPESHRGRVLKEFDHAMMNPEQAGRHF
ncbi:MAG: transglutaminase-like domain-containing protein [Candidatus Omnitrophica bacterium]|nr:transglutaminase-like domain-containing protein [Candidatus Omnitrophota bacterium]MDD5672003.1 transglutaminase-like domain-containing protein [Candidatus Omnitrophota bacterium]